MVWIDSVCVPGFVGWKVVQVRSISRTESVCTRVNEIGMRSANVQQTRTEDQCENQVLRKDSNFMRQRDRDQFVWVSPVQPYHPSCQQLGSTTHALQSETTLRPDFLKVLWWPHTRYFYVRAKRLKVPTIFIIKGGVTDRDTTIQRMTICQMLIERHFWLHRWLSDFIK